MRNAVYDVIAERTRQIEREGFDSVHDDYHSGGELALAACCYAFAAQMPPITREVIKPAEGGVANSVTLSENWPFGDDWWKPTTPRHDLVKAAALIIAEIERIDRLAASAETRQ